jgi:5'-methylthioadenosine phosphorylase
MKKIAIIGGSGVYKFDAVELVNEHELKTPFGDPSGKIAEVNILGAKCFFLPRHGVGHAINPSEINYRANIFALKKLGVDTIISVSAVGSLKEEHAPGDFVLPSQFIDWTKGVRKRTFFEKGVVGHVSVANPVNFDLQDIIAKCLEQVDVKFSKGGSYVCIEGPQFSSRAESEIYRSFKADIIGMTNVPEAYLAKEAGMAYATVAMVTDYDCWKEEHCTLEEIVKVMNKNYKTAQKLVEILVPYLHENPLEFEPENKFAVITNPELIPSEQKQVLDVLLK